MLQHIKSNARLYGFLLGLCSLILTYTYRRYIYSHHIFDFYIADTISSIFCIPAASLFFYKKMNKPFVKVVLANLLAFIIYEFVTILPFHGTFDIADLVALFISTAITLLVYKIVKCYSKNAIAHN